MMKINVLKERCIEEWKIERKFFMIKIFRADVNWGNIIIEMINFNTFSCNFLWAQWLFVFTCFHFSCEREQCSSLHFSNYMEIWILNFLHACRLVYYATLRCRMWWCEWWFLEHSKFHLKMQLLEMNEVFRYTSVNFR